MRLKNQFRRGTIICLLVALNMLSGCSFVHRDYNDNKGIAAKDTYDAKGMNGNIIEGNEGYNVSVKKFDGRIKIAEFDAPDNKDITISLSLSCSKGKAKVVHVLPNNDVILIKEVANSNDNQNPESITLKCTKGSNKIKLVADDASGIDLKLEEATGVFDYGYKDALDDMFEN